MIGEESRGDDNDEDYTGENYKENIGDSMNLSTAGHFKGRPETAGKMLEQLWFKNIFTFLMKKNA